jgi:hypothetical protein
VENLQLHIIALNVPYPPNYGGVMDIYYKLEALHRLGVRVILHCFRKERPEAPELEALCEEVHYYPRHTGWAANLSLLPYNVYGRRSGKLLERLLEDDCPILFEGLHSCHLLPEARLKGRLKIYRAGNIEHDYYRAIARASRGLAGKAFHYVEAWKFRRYENVLRHADLLLAISQTDAAYLRRRFPGQRVAFVPAFHANEEVRCRTGRSDYILYHGKLSVPENEQVALFLIREVFGRLSCPCLIAGMNPSKRLEQAAQACPQVKLLANPSAGEMERLLANAQVNLLVTFQATGLKLKLLNSLFGGRHVVANRLMLSGSGLEALCHLADTPEEMALACRKLMNTPFDEKELEKRRRILLPAYSNLHQAERIIEMIGNK